MQRRYVWSSENWFGLNSRLKKHDKVSFCVYDDGCRNEEDWALNFRSVIVFGHVEFVEDHDFAIQISKELCYKFTQDEKYIEDEIRHAGWRTLVFALVPENITGKRVKES